MIQNRAYAAGIDIPSLPEEIQVALNQVLAGEIELTDFISQMNQFQFSGVFSTFAPDDVVPEYRERVSTPLWSRNVGTLDGNTTLYKGFHTSSTQLGSSGEYYLDVYNASPNLVDQYGPLVQDYPYMEADRDNWVDADVQFAVAFGHYLGHGSTSSEMTDNSATKAIYSQYRNILLDPLDTKFTFDSTPANFGGDSDTIYVINVQRANYKEKLDPGNWELKLAHPSTYLGEFVFTNVSAYLTASSGLVANWNTLISGSSGDWTPSGTDSASLYWVSESVSVLVTVPNSSSTLYADTASGYVTHSFDAAAQPSFTSGESAQPATGSTGSLYRHYGHEGYHIELTDDSTAQVSHRIKAGQRVFDIISGSIESEADLGEADTVTQSISLASYGLFYPDIAVFVLNANALSGSWSQGGIGLQLNDVGYEDAEGGNAEIFYTAVRDGYKFQARSEETITSTHFFCRLKNKQYNFSNNPTYYTASDGSFTNDDFFKNPRTYITTIGLYNDANELLAVAKVSKPLLKSFDREAVIKVKLDF